MAEKELTYVVVAEDHELQAALKDSFFHRAGFALQTIDRQTDAVELVRRLRPVLVILTLDLNGDDGDAVCRKIKADPALRSTPVALVARYEDESQRTRCHESGCEEILRRPLNTRQIVAASYRMLKIVVDRFEFRGSVQLRGRFGTGDIIRQCTLLNLSGSGAFIATGKLVPVDSTLVVEFRLPNEAGMIRCRGRVAWLNHPEWSRNPQLPVGFGLHFEEITPELRTNIEDFIHSAQ